MSVMYATQPLQPLLASKFNISIIEASQFTAVILFFLAVAPIIYGYILEKVNAKKNVNKCFNSFAYYKYFIRIISKL